jgi:hypothetical protein
MAELTLTSIDMRGVSEGVEILLDTPPGRQGDTLWVNVDGICRLRITGLTRAQLLIEDKRRR